MHSFSQDILFDLNSIGNWLKANWYWVLAGFGGLSESHQLLLET